MKDNNIIFGDMICQEMVANFNMFDSTVKDRIVGKNYGASIVTKDCTCRGFNVQSLEAFDAFTTLVHNNYRQPCIRLRLLTTPQCSVSYWTMTQIFDQVGNMYHYCSFYPLYIRHSQCRRKQLEWNQRFHDNKCRDILWKSSIERCILWQKDAISLDPFETEHTNQRKRT